MSEVRLHSYGANPHEALIHQICLEIGEYERRGLDVSLVHGKLPDADAPEPVLTLGIAGATVDEARTGRIWKILLAYTTSPLFWMRATKPLTPGSLAGLTVAGYPEGSPVDHLTRWAFETWGIPADSMRLTHMQGGVAGDLQRLQAVLDADADVAVVGSGLSRRYSDLDLGTTEITFLGDSIKVPSVGLALTGDIPQAAAHSIRSLVEAHSYVLRTLVDHLPEAIRACQSLITPALDEPDASADCESLIRDFIVDSFKEEPDAARNGKDDFLSWLRRPGASSSDSTAPQSIHNGQGGPN